MAKSSNSKVLVAVWLLLFSTAGTLAQNRYDASFFGEISSDFSKLDQTELIDAFGICGATYDILAVGANADLFGQFANGSSMALGMVPVERQLRQRGGVNRKSPNNYPTLVKAIRTAHRAGLMMMESELSTHRTRIVSYLANEPSKFEMMAEETIKVCQANVEFEQEYIDIWRNLVSSGWIQIN
jgi:hypothetical protein